MTKERPKLTVCCYGFDKLGFNLPGSPFECGAFTLRFLGYRSDHLLESADAFVFPSGIFEEISWDDDFLGDRTQTLRHDISRLASVQKQHLNGFNRGAWTVFLLGAVNNGRDEQWRDTDLAKCWLNAFASNVHYHEPNAFVTCKADEFGPFLERFGVSRTGFWVKNAHGTSTVIAIAGDETSVAFEDSGRFFFLPYFSTKLGRDDVIAACRLTVEAVLAYKRKHDIYLPSWVSELRFAAEERIQKDRGRLEEEILRLGDEARHWERRKSVLCTSGGNLHRIVVEILRDFFGLNLKSREKYVEDAVIYGDSEEVRFVVEVKGVNGGVRREHINQVDSHRERLKIDSSIPGLLIINDFMDVDGLEIRKAKPFDQNHRSHAERLNVKILRAVTLFEMMIELEGRELTQRRVEFLDRCEKAAAFVSPSA